MNPTLKYFSVLRPIKNEKKPIKNIGNANITRKSNPEKTKGITKK
jgi:hypothetical protein